jgi:hypothetical protein
VTKQEFIARLTIQCLDSIVWDRVGHDRYAVNAANEAISAAEKIEIANPNFFTKEEQ